MLCLLLRIYKWYVVHSTVARWHVKLPWIFGGLSGYIIIIIIYRFCLGGVLLSSILVSSKVSTIYFTASIQIQDRFQVSMLMIVQTTYICSFQWVGILYILFSGGVISYRISHIRYLLLKTPTAYMKIFSFGWQRICSYEDTFILLVIPFF